MILVFIFVFALLYCPPLLHCTTYRNNSMPTCPESFSCLDLSPFMYPFYNATDTKCGLIKVNCTSKGADIQFGGRLYDILGKYDSNNKSDPNSDYLLIRNGTLDQLVKKNSCEALMNNFTSPSPLLYSIFISPLITLFKCNKNLTSTQQIDAYFKQHKYNSYNICENHSFYYNYVNKTVASDLPHTCQVVQLPVKVPGLGLDETNIFSLLSPVTAIRFYLSPSCSECHKKGRMCDTTNDQFQCLEAKQEKLNREPMDPEKQGRDKIIKIVVIVGSTLILMLSFVIFIIWRYCKANSLSKKKSPKLEDIHLSSGVSMFSIKELQDATQNFNPSHELGNGGFGAVYYGKLQDGREVAVKKLHEHNYKRVQQFFNELEILTKLRHPNLVVLYGFSCRQSHELLLVYEYVSNGTVEDHLHGKQANPTLLTWNIRLNIAIETARALAYLHASEIIHRDVKTNNILLDHNFFVKVADFGLSRLISNDVSHTSTDPQGTPGYVDPQYHQRYQLTSKSDVYSFGVVLIELISSLVVVDLNRSQDEISLANLALKRIQRCEIYQLIDPNLGSDTNPEIKNMITSVAELAFQCLQYESEMRPTMNDVLDVLMDIQEVGGIEAYGGTKDFQTMNVLPLLETGDAVVLLKDFLSSPVSVTSDWHINKSALTR